MFHALANSPPCLTPLQCLLWPLIYMQLIALRDWVRKHSGRVPYWISISKFGRVRLRHLPTDFTFSDARSVSPERGRYDDNSGVTRALLASACAAEETPPAPAPALAMPQTQSGQAPLKKDGPTPIRLKAIFRPRITGERIFRRTAQGLRRAKLLRQIGS